MSDFDALLRLAKLHMSKKPNIPPDYAAEVPHLRQEMDDWRSVMSAYRLVVGHEAMLRVLFPAKTPDDFKSLRGTGD